MQRTATQIMFPDAGDPNIPSLKKSNVTITGTIHNVYLARQQLVVRQQTYVSIFTINLEFYLFLLEIFLFGLKRLHLQMKCASNISTSYLSYLKIVVEFRIS